MIIFSCAYSKWKINNFSCLLLAGFDSLMSSYRLSDLALLYQLFSRVKKGQDELCTAFNEYIRVIISFRLKCCRISSVGRAFDCRAGGRRFDSRGRTITQGLKMTEK